ncbi:MULTISPECIES: DUF6114 domain-containing protein [unclassified Streptomyces]|uniref:DUF6114 domain-containing protein n=1 Tax=unclassified Streptomyces TaxID=2593676 RepID=UPI000DB95184|nr:MULTISPECIES: DUF6114 domain-containing protein [unclassified Streptomyces]MYU06385.1 hypothetical protein [Streptomyces sp. SID8366]MYU67767.1 hypothetical protein [Streptomyces sp. SID69]RAJ56186.1 hypothetical protein K376_04171 [Streptomyces sp. PsTaAH-130]
MSAETPAAESGQFDIRRQQFRAWRGARPFWAGLFILLGGFPIMYFPYAHLQLGHLTLAMATTAGAGSLIIGVLLVVLGVSLWFQKHVRTFAGVAAILLALVSLPVSNFGGFVLGFLFALIGGAMAVAWAPGEPGGPESQAGEAAPGTGGAPESVPLPGQGTAGAYEPNDLSGTSPANGANGRHSAG